MAAMKTPTKQNKWRNSKLRVTQAAQWDYVLPEIPVPARLNHTADSACNEDDDTDDYGLTPYGSRKTLGSISIPSVVGAIQGGYTCEIIRNYLTHYREQLTAKELQDHLNSNVKGIPAFFYIVESGKVDMVKLWASYGADVNVTHLGVPLIVFAIGLCRSFQKHTVMIVKILLSTGASVDAIPRAFYTPLDRDLPDSGPADDELDDLDDDNKAWCVPSARRRVARALNFSFTIRYDLHYASGAEKVSGAMKQVAKKLKSIGILGIPYFLIGQRLACRLLVEKFINHLAMPSKGPLVLLFAGPSGHGKTELARRLGELLTLNLHNVDCTGLAHETDLFGPRAPYWGHQEGSATNNFLAGQDGARSIIFLDEFEKTNQGVRQSLLIPFQNGEYTDRRYLTTVDCSKTIWVLATNAFDATIHSFCARYYDQLFANDNSKKSQETLKDLGQKLSRKIRKECIGRFGAPLTGRIKEFIPFLTFSAVEQAAVADMYLSDLGGELTKPIDDSDDEKLYRPVGNINLDIKRGYSVCKALAAQGYVEELGARSIINTIDQEVKAPLVSSYLSSREEISPDQPTVGFAVGVDSDGEQVEVTELGTDVEEIDLDKVVEF
ncbi:P-loop containing nucleoside triphosphate hydrolase protein [Cladorrhinum sp. PSN259]|nr:P-loop containing nucleoside triphosphate hydrolase protein [Cladorrhinum sp. PSN259]